MEADTQAPPPAEMRWTMALADQQLREDGRRLIWMIQAMSAMRAMHAELLAVRDRNIEGRVRATAEDNMRMRDAFNRLALAIEAGEDVP